MDSSLRTTTQARRSSRSRPGSRFGHIGTLGAMAGEPPTTLRERAARYTPAQRLTIDVALDLFADHGVSGTSFQMIADEVGVTKGAIYHQFGTKDAIVLGVLEVQLQPLEEAVEEAERG